jgi:hypothetical protein
MRFLTLAPHDPRPNPPLKTLLRERCFVFDGLYPDKSVSPVAVLKSESDQVFKPLYLVDSERDSMSWYEIEDMRCALLDKSINSTLYTIRTIAGATVHSFALSLDQISPPSSTKLRDEVVAFLEDHVKNYP